MALIESFRKQGDFLFRFRSYMPLLLLISGLAFYIYMHYTNQYNFDIIYFWICFGISFFGLFIRSITIGFTPKNTSGRNTKKQVADVVNTTAMYSIVRHPLYLGNFFMWLGLALLSASIWFVLVFVLVFWIYYERIMYAEEFFLREKFGMPYLEWANKVPSFIPRFSSWKSSELYFSFRKVVKRETLGLFKLVLCFFIFQLIHEYFINNFNLDSISQFGRIWLYIFIVMLIFYLIVRTLNKKTKFFVEEGR
ncbi:MAG: isoprenylcysteine carboxylmethyltransferase family protein [Bacteroidales bacterium]